MRTIQEPANFDGWATARSAEGFAKAVVLPGGRFAFEALPKRRCDLRVGHHGPTSEAEIRDVEAGTRDLTVRLEERT